MVERAIRPLALNRKNALFAGPDGGAEHGQAARRWAARLRSTTRIANGPGPGSMTSCPGLTRQRRGFRMWPGRRLPVP